MKPKISLFLSLLLTTLHLTTPTPTTVFHPVQLPDPPTHVTINNLSPSQVLTTTKVNITHTSTYSSFIATGDRSAMQYTLFINDDISAPIILWLNDQPGCSSWTSVFGGVGPITIDQQGNMISHSVHSVAEKFSLIFMDAQLGTGFSYVTNQGDYATDLGQAAQYYLHGLNVLFQKYDVLRQKKFYIAGEGYGTKLALKIYSVWSQQKNLDSFDISGLMIGSPLLSISKQLGQMGQYGVANALLDLQGLSEIDVRGDVVKKFEQERFELVTHAKYTELRKWLSEQAGYELGSDSRQTKSQQIISQDQTKRTEIFGLESVKSSFNIPSTATYSECPLFVKAGLFGTIMEDVTDLLQYAVENTKILFYTGQDNLEVSPSSLNALINILKWKKKDDFYKSKKRIVKDEDETRVSIYHNQGGNVHRAIITDSGKRVAEQHPDYLNQAFEIFINS